MMLMVILSPHRRRLSGGVRAGEPLSYMEITKLIIIFALLMLFLGLGKPMYVVMPCAVVAVGLFYAMPPLTWLTEVGRSLISQSTVMLGLTVWLVMLMEGVMNANGYLSRLTQSMDELFHSRRLNIISLPLIIGFLPSAGGAVLSAPMVEEAAKGCGLDASTKANVNNFYRHTMELGFPTYSAIIILSQISGVGMSVLILRLLPVAAFALLLGLTMLRRLPAREEAEEETDKARPGAGRRVWNLLVAMWPFVLLLALIMAGGLPVHISCLITLAVLCVTTRTGPQQWWPLIRTKTKWRLLVITVSIMVFKDLLSASGAIDALPPVISQLPLPPMIIYSLMCLFISIITGVIFSGTGIVVPLLMATIPGFTPSMLAFLQVSGYVGAQITPVHSCVTLSADYFQANLGRTILRSLPLYALIYLLALVLYLVLWV